MSKYHINQETGRANICRATEARGCPLGADTPHFDTKIEAKQYIEKHEANNNDKFSTIDKNKNAANKNVADNNKSTKNVGDSGLEANNSTVSSTVNSVNPVPVDSPQIVDYIIKNSNAQSRGRLDNNVNPNVLVAQTAELENKLRSSQASREAYEKIFSSHNPPKNLVDAAFEGTPQSYEEIAQTINGRNYLPITKEKIATIDAKHMKEIYPHLNSSSKNEVLRYTSDSEVLSGAIRRLSEDMPNSVDREWAGINAYHNKNITGEQKNLLAQSNSVVASLQKIEHIEATAEPDLVNRAVEEYGRSGSGHAYLRFNPEVIHKYNLSQDDVSAMLMRKHDQWRSRINYNAQAQRYTFDTAYN